MSMEAEVRALIAKSARVEPSEVTPDADLFDDLRIDSLEGLRLLATLEQRYGVTIPDHYLARLRRLKDIVTELEVQLGQRTR